MITFYDANMSINLLWVLLSIYIINRDSLVSIDNNVLQRRVFNIFVKCGIIIPRPVSAELTLPDALFPLSLYARRMFTNSGIFCLYPIITGCFAASAVVYVRSFSN